MRRSELPVSAEAAFAWHMRPGALERLTPPWVSMRVVRRDPGIREGAQVELALSVAGVPVRWLAEHHDFQWGRGFSDLQRRGPFAHWHHHHRFEPLAADRCVLEDCVEYALPAERLTAPLAAARIERQVDTMFAYRHAVTVADLTAHARHKEQATMRIAVTGSSGLVGSELVNFLTTGGHEVVRLVRGSGGTSNAGAASHDRVVWDPTADRFDAAPLDGVDAVVHLAGESIASGRWTETQKRRIRESRVHGTRVLSEALAAMANPPRVYVGASAIGYYGDRGDESLDEDSPPGDLFLSGVCRDWEAASQPAADAGIRVALTRLGVVLSPKGGALSKMLTPFRLGAGGRVGDGRQYWSWVAIDDVIGALHHALMTDSLAGPVNVVAPHPVTNLEFTKTLGRVLRRPTVAPMPAFAARLLLGQMADELLLARARVEPQRLLESHYHFRHPNLEDALRHVLGRPG
ncbi:MAG: TIGR01777 family oxidoreductase [Pirellulales bacterium]